MKFSRKHTYVLLFQRYRTVAVVEVEEMFRFHSKEGPNILVIRKSGRQTNETTIVMCLLNLAESSKKSAYTHTL